MTYAEKLEDARWKAKRHEILLRDGFKCRDCGQTPVSPQVHHCYYRGDPWDVPNALLLTLCPSCHRERQEIEDRAHRTVSAMMATNRLADLRTLFP